MTSASKIVNPASMVAADAQASVHMKEGIRLLDESPGNAEAALRCFDRALELRRGLPTEVAGYAYGLAACWLNRADALVHLRDTAARDLARLAYDEAIALLRTLPLTEAIAVLDATNDLEVRERDYLLAVVCMNLANVWASEPTRASDIAARNAAQRTITLVASHEWEAAPAAEAGLKFAANLKYVSIAAHIQRQHLPLLAKFFFVQAAEERQHALKFVKYILEVQGELQIPTIAAPTTSFASAEQAVATALTWEREVTAQITGLMDHAVKESDYMAQSFLQWFVDEQLEEVVKMGRLLGVVRRAGESNLLMVEAYLRHIDQAA
jgi:bacterioferritin B